MDFCNSCTQQIHDNIFFLVTNFFSTFFVFCSKKPQHYKWYNNQIAYKHLSSLGNSYITSDGRYIVKTVFCLSRRITSQPQNTTLGLENVFNGGLKTMASQFSRDGKYYAQLTSDGKLKVWDTTSGTFEQEFLPNFHLASPCTCLHFIDGLEGNRGKVRPL